MNRNIKNRKVLIIGAGGIGSFLIPLLHKTGLYDMHVYDPDIVEIKNITYQNFEEEEVDENKAEIMSNRYDTVTAFPYPVLTSQQIKGSKKGKPAHSLVICCADNLDIRKTLYNTNVSWLDLRAQGRNATMVSYLEKPELRAELTHGPEGSFSCQGNEWDGGNENVHYMQVAIAGMGAEWIQRWYMDEDVFTNKLIAG